MQKDEATRTVRGGSTSLRVALSQLPECSLAFVSACKLRGQNLYFSKEAIFLGLRDGLCGQTPESPF